MTKRKHLIYEFIARDFNEAVQRVNQEFDGRQLVQLNRVRRYQDDSWEWEAIVVDY